MATRRFDHFATCFNISAYDRVKVFGIKAPCERRRANEITEHNGQLATLDRTVTPPAQRRIQIQRHRVIATRDRRSHRRQLGDRLAQSPTMPQWHAEALEIVLRQLRQYLAIDVVLSEQRPLLAQTKLI